VPDKRPFMIGLTGSIGMGKSETSKMFAKLGIPVYDADAAVHRLYDVGGAAVPAIEAAFPGTTRDGKVDRAELGRRVTNNEAETERLQRIVYPLMAGERKKFLDDAVDGGHEFVLFDIPRLFETGGEAGMDAVVVCSAPAHVQKERVLARPGMNEDLFKFLHSRQTPDEEKRAKAHFVVETDKGLAHAFEQVKSIMATLKERQRASKDNA
jgi:dephospho-CoA kinase